MFLHIFIGFITLLLMYARHRLFGLAEEKINFTTGEYGLVWPFIESKYIVTLGVFSLFFFIVVSVFCVLFPSIYFVCILYPLSKLNNEKVLYKEFMQSVLENVNESWEDDF